VSGKKQQRTAKTTTVSDSYGRLLWSGTDRPGRMYDQTAVRTEGIAEQFGLHPKVNAEADEGYRGLTNEFPDQVSAPPKKPKDDAPLGERHAWREQRRRPSSRRICVEHVIGEEKKWCPLRRHTGRREYETHAAIDGWSPTAPPADRPGTGRAPNWCPSGARPADHHQTVHQASTFRRHSRTTS
jgi:hypothetical protein